MSREDVELVQAGFAAFAGGRNESFFEFLAEDVEWRVVKRDSPILGRALGQT